MTTTRKAVYVALGSLVIVVGFLFLRPRPSQESDIPPSAAMERFERLPMQGATEAQLATALQWRSAIESEPHPSDQGRVFVSLNPAAACAVPTIWNVTQGGFIEVELPAPVDCPTKTNACVALGAFHGGLAPASVVYESTTPCGELNKPVWGYVDTKGKWVIPPRYADAGTFVADIAVVAATKDDLRLINRQGKELSWKHGALRFAHENDFGKKVSLVRLGKWVWVNHFPSGPAEGNPTFLTDGVRMIPIPGDTPRPSIDGELWVLQASQGMRLWKPTGFVELPDDLTPVMAVTGNLFTAHSHKLQSVGLYATDGRAVAEQREVLRVITPTRFVSCDAQGSYPGFLQDASNRRIPTTGEHCGILDESGRWWAKPVHQVIEFWSEHEVRLQSGTDACVADLLADKAPECGPRTALTMPMPVLNMKQNPRGYAYRKPDGTTTPSQYATAFPYMGKVAAASDKSGFPGLTDESGNWLTPRPFGDLLAETQLRTAMARSRARYSENVPQGFGVIDRAGKWVIPPVFGQIRRYADGTLHACRLTLDSNTGECLHLDTSGKPLSPMNEPLLDDNGASREETAEKSEREEATLLATAINGRWGFQDRDGRWVIEPRFDDAYDFAGDMGVAGMWRGTDTEDISDYPERKMEWGIIGPSGDWIVEPKFHAIFPYKRGVLVAQEGGLYGLVNGKGDWLSPPEYSDIGVFVQGVATATRVGGEQCKLSEDGLCKGSFVIERATRIDDGYTPAKEPGGRLYGYIARNGEWIIPPTFSDTSPFVGEFAVARGALPDIPEEWCKRWVTVSAQPLMRARVFAVEAEHPGSKERKEARVALADDTGHWLLPIRASSILQWSSDK